MTFEAWLAKQGFDLDTLTPQQLDSLESSWRRETNTPANPGTWTAEANDFETVMAGLRAGQAHGQKITAMVAAAAKDHPDQLDAIEAIGRSALAGNWNDTQTELALLRAVRPSAPSPLSRNGREASERVIECALARTSGMSNSDAERHYDARTLEQADRQFKGGLTIGELILSFARRNGYADASIRGNLSQTLEHALLSPRASVSAPSNYTLSGILSNLSNKSMRDDFMAVEQEWRKVTAIASTTDFKEYTSYNLVGDLDFKEVPRGGQLDHGTLDEEEYGNKVKQHGRMLAIDRTDLINDDMSVFAKARRRLSRGAATALNKIFWREWNRIAGFNTAGNGNFDDGADSVFNEAGLEKADALFRAQTDPDGEPLGVLPRILVVPSGARIAAIKLMNSMTAAAGDAEGDANPWSGMFEVVSSVYMSSTALDGTATRWALIADPAALAAIEVAFLNGVETPTVNEVAMSPDRLGIILQAFLDFGVRRQERRARVVMAGA